MTSEQNRNSARSEHEADVMLDEVIGTLYRDIAQWDVEVRDLTPYGPAVVQRSVHGLIDAHVERLRHIVKTICADSPRQSPITNERQS